MARTWRSWPAAMSLAAAVLLAACTDLTAVREWADTSLEATRYNEIVATYADTPQRLARYQPSVDWASETEERKRQAEALREMLSLVSDYMGALSVLAADGTVDYSQDADALKGSLANLDVGIAPATLGAVGSLVETILGAAAKAYQSGKVSEVVGQANAPLQAILAGELRSIVDEDFRADLEIERTSMDLYYKRLLRVGEGSEPANVALTEWFELRQAQNAQRFAAVDAYVEVLDRIAEGHQKLYEQRDDLDARQLIVTLVKLGKEIRKQISILAAA